MQKRVALSLGIAMIFIGCSPRLPGIHRGKQSERNGWTAVFDFDKADFTATGRNAYFILEPGYRSVFQGTERGKSVRLTITVLNDTEQIDGVMTRIVEERETRNGTLVEVSRNAFALNQKTKAVFYFGEAVDNYRQGQIHNHEGSWRAGLHEAKYGLMMPAFPLVGARFYQERAPGIALDRAEIVSVSDTLTVPAGEFHPCVRVAETTPLEPTVREYKVYAPGVGLIKDGTLTLTESGFITE